MAKRDEKLDPSAPSAAYEFMSPKWNMIETLLGGTSSMRDAGEDYLPKHPAEDDYDYHARLNQTTLYNVTELTLNSLVGRVFRESMLLNNDAPQEIKDMSSDMDSLDNDLSSVAQRWFRESLAKGFAHMFVDMPSMSPEEKQYRTKADDLQDNRRPYWCLLKPENVIFMHWERAGADDVLTTARFIEQVTTVAGFSEVVQTRVRVLYIGEWQIWINENEGTSKKASWVMQSQGLYDLDEIPLVTYYTAQTGQMLAKPPLEDLAFMNIRHWQSTSDQNNVLTVSRFPILAASGAQIERGKNTMPIGPRQLMTMRDPNGRFYYVEHTGKAISAGADDLKQLEDRMAAYGAEFLRRQVAGRTAFERAQDTNEAISPLKDMALRFEEAVARALDLSAKWLGIAPDGDKHIGGTVTINTKFTEEDVSDVAIKALGEARKRADISRKTFIEELIRRGFVDQTKSADAEITQILEELKTFPVTPTFVSATESIRVMETANPASTADTIDGNTTPAAPAPSGPAKTPAKAAPAKAAPAKP